MKREVLLAIVVLFLTFALLFWNQNSRIKVDESRKMVSVTLNDTDTWYCGYWDAETKEDALRSAQDAIIEYEELTAQ